MLGYIFTEVMLLLITYRLIGFHIWSIFATIAVLLFAGRVIGYFCELKHLIALDFMGFFITIVFQLLSKNVKWKMLLLMLLVRGISIVVALIEMNLYVYIKREEKV